MAAAKGGAKASDGKRVAVYVRVSTDGQTVENQLREMRAVARRHGWEIAATFRDQGISGAKGRDGRPGFDALCAGIARRDFEMVAAWSVDRLGRSLQDLVAFLGELAAKRIDLYLHRQGLDTSTPAGRAMFQMLGVFAEFERALIRERVVAGLERARAKGTRLGRPRVGAKVERCVLEARRAGKGIHAIARELAIGVGTVQRIIGPRRPSE
jgi:DNA invertase Pin-like site-specific DNA recombinase